MFKAKTNLTYKGQAYSVGQVVPCSEDDAKVLEKYHYIETDSNGKKTKKVVKKETK